MIPFRSVGVEISTLICLPQIQKCAGMYTHNLEQSTTSEISGLRIGVSGIAISDGNFQVLPR